MKEYKTDTSETYDDFVGYVSEEALPSTLSVFMGGADEKKHEVKPKSVDPEFSEQWQTIYINFTSIEHYKNFMILAGERPVPKLKEFVYSRDKVTSDGILTFFGEEE